MKEEMMKVAKKDRWKKRGLGRRGGGGSREKKVWKELRCWDHKTKD